MSDFSERLRQLRWSHDMTMKQFAESLDVNANTYSSVESGRRNPSIKILKELILVYNIDITDWILDV